MPQESPLNIEGAIKLLQRSGYTVFQTTAAAKLTAVDTCPLPAYQNYRDDPNFTHHVRSGLTRAIATELLDSGLLVFTLDVTGKESGGFPAYSAVNTATLEVFPAERREWGRR